MISIDRLFEGGRRLSVVVSLLWVSVCLVPVFISGEEVWSEYQAKVTLRKSFWEFAKKEIDKIGPWTVFRYEDRWDNFATTVGVFPESWFLKDELHLFPPSDSLENDIKGLRERSWKRFADKAQGAIEFSALGVLAVFAFRKACGWVVRGFIDSKTK